MLTFFLELPRIFFFKLLLNGALCFLMYYELHRYFLILIFLESCLAISQCIFWTKIEIYPINYDDTKLFLKLIPQLLRLCDKEADSLLARDGLYDCSCIAFALLCFSLFLYFIFRTSYDIYIDRFFFYLSQIF